jgi:hypothetical protein
LERLNIEPSDIEPSMVFFLGALAAALVAALVAALAAAVVAVVAAVVAVEELGTFFLQLQLKLILIFFLLSLLNSGLEAIYIK